MSLLQYYSRQYIVQVNYMRYVARKPVIRVSDKVQHKQGCTTIEDGYRVEISDLGSTENVLSEAKTKALVSCTVTAQLTRAFVFAYAKSLFSRDAAHISMGCCNISYANLLLRVEMSSDDDLFLFYF